MMKLMIVMMMTKMMMMKVIMMKKKMMRMMIIIMMMVIVMMIIMRVIMKKKMIMITMTTMVMKKMEDREIFLPTGTTSRARWEGLDSINDEKGEKLSPSLPPYPSTPDPTTSILHPKGRPHRSKARRSDFRLNNEGRLTFTNAMNFSFLSGRSQIHINRSRS
ncbi:unnamed protein product [Nesidiocoris tenuis]|uniref:Uncharacterized protein n=1 Tax=Nesidiocoris tenuis TaxID=355587 RepID=A0A6H5HFV1_9HEMI|nr:unnamed protein product [Nesidiocoris tenuis]